MLAPSGLQFRYVIGRPLLCHVLVLYYKWETLTVTSRNGHSYHNHITIAVLAPTADYPEAVWSRVLAVNLLSSVESSPYDENEQ